MVPGHDSTNASETLGATSFSLRSAIDGTAMKLPKTLVPMSPSESEDAATSTLMISMRKVQP